VRKLLRWRWQRYHSAVKANCIASPDRSVMRACMQSFHNEVRPDCFDNTNYNFMFRLMPYYFGAGCCFVTGAPLARFPLTSPLSTPSVPSTSLCQLLEQPPACRVHSCSPSFPATHALPATRPATFSDPLDLLAGTNVMIRARTAFLVCRFDENPHAADTQDLPQATQALYREANGGSADTHRQLFSETLVAEDIDLGSRVHTLGYKCAAAVSAFVPLHCSCSMALPCAVPSVRPLADARVCILRLALQRSARPVRLHSDWPAKLVMLHPQLLTSLGCCAGRSFSRRCSRRARSHAARATFGSSAAAGRAPRTCTS
jgi:hypothetical protein